MEIGRRSAARIIAALEDADHRALRQILSVEIFRRGSVGSLKRS
jgi:hypothetical protein